LKRVGTIQRASGDVGSNQIDEGRRIDLETLCF